MAALQRICAAPTCVRELSSHNPGPYCNRCREKEKIPKVSEKAEPRIAK